MSRQKFYLGFAYINGYLRSFINKRKRISDREIIEYHHGAHFQNVIFSIIKKE